MFQEGTKTSPIAETETSKAVVAADAHIAVVDNAVVVVVVVVELVVVALGALVALVETPSLRFRAPSDVAS